MRFTEHADCELFGAYLQDMMDDADDGRVPSDEVADEVWSSLPDAWRLKLKKISKNRWFAVTDELQHLHKIWTKRLVGNVVNCLRNNLLVSASVRATLAAYSISEARVARHHAASSSNAPRESTSREPDTLKNLRRISQTLSS